MYIKKTKSPRKLTTDNLLTMIREEIKDIKEGALNPDFTEILTERLKPVLEEASIRVGMRNYKIADEAYNAIVSKVRRNILAFIEEYEAAQKGKKQ